MTTMQSLLSGRGLIALGTALLLCVIAVVGTIVYHQLTPDVPEARARWAIRQVDRAVFGGVPIPGSNCFSSHTGHSTATVFVSDPSYTNYQTVNCTLSVHRSAGDYLLTVTESWDDTIPPTGWGPIGWVRRLFYRPASHKWLYRVRPDGAVLTLPERGAPAPQTYYH